jgi:hypothetical protein
MAVQKLVKKNIFASPLRTKNLVLIGLHILLHIRVELALHDVDEGVA